MNSRCTSKPWADYLVARLRHQPAVYPAITMEYDWQILMAWPEVSRCWIAVAAIVQIVLRGERQQPTTIVEAAKVWLRDHCHQPLVQAVITFEASRSVVTRDRVMSEIWIPYADGLVPTPAQELWRAISTRRIREEEVKDAFDLAGSGYLDTPHERQRRFWAACRRLRPAADQADLPRLIEETVDCLAFTAHEEVRWAVINLAGLTPANPFILSALGPYLGTVLWPEVQQVLTPVEEWGHDLIAQRQRGILDALVDQLSSLTPDQLEWLVTVDQPATWRLADQLLPLLPETVDLTGMLRRGYQIWLHSIRCWYSDSTAFGRLLKTLPVVRLVSYLRAQARENRLGSWEVRRLSEDPETCHEIYGPCIAQGYGTREVVTDYLTIVGARGRENLQSWLMKVNLMIRASAENTQPLVERIIEWDLDPGKLLNPVNACLFVQSGYQLQARDLATDQGERRLLPCENPPANSQPVTPWAGWLVGQTPEVILAHGRNQPLMIRSLLHTLEQQSPDIRTQWYDQHLAVLLVEIPWFREAIDAVVFGTNTGWEAIGRIAALEITARDANHPDRYEPWWIDRLLKHLATQRSLLEQLCRSHCIIPSVIV